MSAMKHDQALREHLLNLLIGDGAHVNFEVTVNDLPANLRGKRPNGAQHSAWAMLEHLRIVQWDILEFIRNAKHVAPEVPAGPAPGRGRRQRRRTGAAGGGSGRTAAGTDPGGVAAG